MDVSPRSRHRRPHPPLPIKDGLNPTRVRVPDDADGMTAFDFVWHLKTHQRHRSSADTMQHLRTSFRNGEVRMGLAPRDQQLSPESRVIPGTDIWFYRMPADEVEVPFRCEIVYDDDRLLVVDKPPFLATMPRGKHITQTATVQLRRDTGIDELSPAHRLDRLTSGVLVFVKHRKHRGLYQRLFAERAVEKTYEAIAAANPQITPTTVWRDRMEKTSGEVQGRIVVGEVNAITAVTGVALVDAAQMQRLQLVHGDIGQQARYELKPLTGRTHQLRLHMWHAGVPILGDPTYPDVHPENYADFSTPLRLTARQLRFTDPIDHTVRVFRSHREF